MIGWKSQAKTFVEFYSPLFLPFGEDFNLLPPHNSILPWNDATSWDQFWTVFNNFENSTNFYERAVWYIFQNMVDNMRQRSHERSLVTKWRFMKADAADENVEAHQTEHSELQTTDHSDDENDLDAIQHIIQQVRDKYGSDAFASPKQHQRKKANRFVNAQVETYRQLQQFDSSQRNKPKRFNKYTLEDCKNMATKALLETECESDSENSNFMDVDPQHVMVEFNVRKNIILKPFQTEAVNKLKAIKTNETGSDDIKPGQLLAFMQGVPGAGKTTTASKLAEKLGLTVIFSGTTGTAAAQLKSDTINKLLCLGLNETDVTEKTISITKRQKIQKAFEDVELLVIDEVSMLTPVTLTKIDMYLPSSLDSDYLFGGLSVLLIGDMYQFPPVQRGLKKPALYQAAVMLALGLNLPNEAYRMGAQIFTRFRLVILDGQVRASPEFDQWLGQLRNPAVEYPVTDEWLSKLTTLSTNDFLNKDIKWSDTTIVVSGNLERYKFIQEKIKTFGTKQKQPILRWICPLKTGRKQFQVPNFNPEGMYDQLVKYFVRGAKCVLTESLETKLGLGKGSEGILLDVVWKNEEQTVDLDQLPAGEITSVTQPDYIVIQIDEREIAIKPKSTTFEDVNNKKRSYLAHECELAFAVTFHKMQGKTVDTTILSLNSTTGISRKIYPVSLPSLYVGCSRVHDHQHLRVLPLSSTDKAYLKTLKWDPYLRMFFQNFDETGKWKPNGLQEHRAKFVKSVKLELGLIDLDQLTVDEMKKFARDLDVIVSKPDRQAYITKLFSAHAEGRNMLKKDGSHLLNLQRLKFLKELQKHVIQTMTLQKLRHYAKRLGINNCMTASRSKLQQKLQKCVQRPSIIVDTDQDIDMISNSEPEQEENDILAMDVEQPKEQVMLQQKLQKCVLRQSIIMNTEHDIDMILNSEPEHAENGILAMDVEQAEEQVMPLEQEADHDMIIDDDDEEIVAYASNDDCENEKVEFEQTTLDNLDLDQLTILLRADPNILDVD